jgi:hypothetical protein
VSFRFWQRWLQCVSAASALLGSVFLIAPAAPPLAMTRRAVFGGAVPAAEVPPAAERSAGSG